MLSRMYFHCISLLPLPDPRGSRKWAILAGTAGGMVGALFGTGGPFYIVYLKMRQLDKGALRATIAMVFLFDGGLRITGYAINHHLHIKMNERQFSKIISLLLLLSGIMLIYKSF